MKVHAAVPGKQRDCGELVYLELHVTALLLAPEPGPNSHAGIPTLRPW